MATVQRCERPVTKVERKLWRFMVKYQQRYGVAPATTNLAAELGTSVPYVSTLLLRLRLKGYVASHPRGKGTMCVAIPDPIQEVNSRAAKPKRAKVKA